MKKYVCLVLLAVLSIGYFACTDDLETEKKNDFSVDDAKAWIDSQYPEILSLKSGIGGPAKKQYKPQWETAIKSENEKVEVVETYIATTGIFGFASNESFDEWQATGEPGYISSLTKLVILKQKKSNKIESFLMTFVGDKAYLDMTCFELWNNKYLTKTDDFSGHVLFHSLEGEFVNGWRFTNGQVTHRVELGDGADVPLELKSAMVCETYTYVAFSPSCTDWYSVVLENGEPDWGTAKWMYAACDITPEEISLTECMMINTDGGAPAGGIPGGYNPPTDPDPVPCDCNICPRCGGCMGEVLKSGSISCPDCLGHADMAFFQEIDQINLDSPTLLQEISCLMRDLKLNGGSLITTNTFVGVGDNFLQGYNIAVKYFNYEGSEVEIDVIYDAESEAARMGNRTETQNGEVVFHEIFVKGEVSPSGDLPNLIRIKFKDEDFGLYESVWKHIKGETNLWNCN